MLVVAVVPRHRVRVVAVDVVGRVGVLREEKKRVWWKLIIFIFFIFVAMVFVFFFCNLMIPHDNF